MQILSPFISKRTVELEESDLKQLFLVGEISDIDLRDGYYTLKYHNSMIASLYVENKKVRIRLPHKFNLIL